MMDFPPAPAILRQRHELRRRSLTVARIEVLTPSMIRITLTGEALQGFVSAAPDDHIKIFVPGGGEKPEMRDYTPRRFDAARQELVVDFAVHEAGPATLWALQARVGDVLEIAGPRGSQVIAGDIRSWLLIGDETALPAIGRRIEEAAPGTRIDAMVAIPDAADRQVFDTAADLTLRWIFRPGSAATDPAPLLDRLAETAIPPGTFVWIAAEARVARALRSHLLEDRGHPPGWLKAFGYWVAGEADQVVHFD